ncbi:MAG: polysaccharide deacetylase [Gammaproteobacteria bacterium]|nr:polysaccharide deacetylase [Gammaproteobacteria bacterium]
MTTGQHKVALTFDFDTITNWLANGRTSPTPISRGEFGLVGAQRLLTLLERFDIQTTWFIPGLTIDLYPEACRAIHGAGHEIAHHGYEHVAPGGLSRDDEASQLERGNEAIHRISGQNAKGYRSPAWDLSPNSVELLLEHGFVYDSSMMGHDYLPYRARSGDIIDAERGVEFGEETSLIELPISWSLDDYPHFEWVRGGGLQNAGGVYENWLDDFLYMQENLETGVLTYTCHPSVIGRGHRMKMLQRLIERLLELGARFVTAETAVAESATWPGS